MSCTEKNYISRLKNRKEDALEFIVDKYLGLVKSAVYKVLSPLERDGIIDECVNDVFLSVWNVGILKFVVKYLAITPYL